MPKYQLFHSWVKPVPPPPTGWVNQLIIVAVLNFRFSLRKDLTGAHTTNGLVGLVRAFPFPFPGSGCDDVLTGVGSE